MGFDRNGARFLASAAADGVDFSQTLTLGRQYLHLSQGQLSASLKAFGFLDSTEKLLTDIREAKGYGEPFLKRLGARTVDSMDASPYEQATLIHDLNRPVSEDLHGRYTAVIDSGSLEHVFNFPLAIQNCMAMLCADGHFLGITPTNNFMGHGFYQFSPELFFRIFCQENGFELERLWIFEEHSRACYSVMDPDVIKRRVELVNERPTYLLIQARKTAQVDKPFAVAPQQSDYASQWQGSEMETQEKIQKKTMAGSLTDKLRNVRYRLPDWLVALSFSVFWRTRMWPLRLSNRRLFSKLEKARLQPTKPRKA